MKLYQIFIHGGKGIINKYVHICMSMLLTMAIGCDHSVPIKINKNKVYTISTNCGTIESMAHTFSRNIWVNQVLRGGMYEINIDSMRAIVRPPSAAFIENIKYRINGQEVLNPSFSAGKGDKITVIFELDTPTIELHGSLLILPCDFILCDGKPLISDTLELE